MYVTDISAFARDWCERYHIVGELADECLQEAWVAGLEHEHESQAIEHAMRRFCRRERRAMGRVRNFTDAGVDEAKL